MSVTVQMTALVPTAYGSVPSLTTLATPQLSLVLPGAPRNTFVAVHWPASALTVTLAGQLIVGAWLSTTITSCVHVAHPSHAAVVVGAARCAQEHVRRRTLPGIGINRHLGRATDRGRLAVHD